MLVIKILKYYSVANSIIIKSVNQKARGAKNIIVK